MRGICCLYTSNWQTFSAKGQIVKDFCSVGHSALLQLFSSAVVVWKQLLRDNTNGCGFYSKSWFTQTRGGPDLVSRMPVAAQIPEDCELQELLSHPRLCDVTLYPDPSVMWLPCCLPTISSLGQDCELFETRASAFSSLSHQTEECWEHRSAQFCLLNEWVSGGKQGLSSDCNLFFHLPLSWWTSKTWIFPIQTTRFSPHLYICKMPSPDAVICISRVIAYIYLNCMTSKAFTL